MNIRPKSTEQLRSQKDMVDLERSLRGVYPLELPEQYTGSEAELETRARLARDSADQMEQLFAEDYQQYSEDLREIRTQQYQLSKEDPQTSLGSSRNALHRAVKNNYANVSPRAFEVVQKLPVLGWDYLHNNNKHDFMAGGVKSPQGFSELLEAIAKNQMNVLSNLESLSEIMPKEKLKTLVLGVNAEAYFYSLKYIEQILGEEIARQCVENVLSGKTVFVRQNERMSFLLSEVVGKYVTPANLARPIQDCIQEGAELGIVYREKIVAFGILSETELAQIIVDTCANKATAVGSILPHEATQTVELYRNNIDIVAGLKGQAFANAEYADLARTFREDLSIRQVLVAKAMPTEEKKQICRDLLEASSGQFGHINSLVDIFSREELLKIAKSTVLSHTIDDMQIYNLISEIRHSGLFAPQEISGWLEELVQEGLGYSALDQFLKVLSDGTRQKVLEEYLQAANFQYLLLVLDNISALWLDTPEQLKQHILASFAANPDLAIHALLGKYLDREEIRTLIFAHAEEFATEGFYFDKHLLEVLTPEEIRSLTLQLHERNITKFYDLMFELGEFFETQELRELILQDYTNPKAAMSLRYEAELMRSILNHEEYVKVAGAIGLVFPSLHTTQFMTGRIGSGEFVRFIVPNAVAASEQNHRLSTEEYRQVLENTRASFVCVLAPKLVGGLLDRFEAGGSDSNSSVAQKLENYTQQLCNIHLLGLEEHYLRLRGDLSSERLERDLLEFFVPLTLIGAQAAQEFLSQISSLEELRYQTTRLTMQKLDIDLESVDIGNVLGALPLFPLAVYTQQYAKSSEHKKILQNIVESVSAGSYNAWRLGDYTSETLQQMQEAKLLPNTLDFEQWGSWQAEDTSSRVGEANASAAKVASVVQSTLRTNLHYFSADASLPTAEEATMQIRAYEEQERLLGRAVASLQKDLKIARTIDQSLSSNRAKTLMAEAAEVAHQQTMVRYQKALLRLYNLTPAEIAIGYTINPTNGKRQQPIRSLIATLGATELTERTRVLDSVLGTLTEYAGVASEQIRYTCTDSIDPSLTLQIGAVPQASCQHYSDGMLNECLLGYFEPNTKILVVKNSRGAPVARAVFRLLTDEEGKPALFCEAIYRNSSAKTIDTLLYAHAKTKADAMGVALYVSRPNSNEQYDLPQGTSLQDSKQSLASSGMRAPAVYVDSAEGKNFTGHYSIRSLAQIR